MKKNILLTSLLFMIVLASRLLPHPANFSPISILLIFIPVFFQQHSKQLFMTSLLALFISDIVLGSHTTMPYVYASYFFIWIAGRYAAKLKETFSFFTVPLFTGMLFYVITNFGVWATTTMYPRTVAGLLESYWMAIPFLKMTMLGDVFFFCTFYALSIVYADTKSPLSSRKAIVG